MARIRSIKPEMRRSLTVASWPIPVRWTFVGLLGYLDDHGRGIDDTRLVKAELYPLDDDVTARKIDGHLNTIVNCGPLCRYEIDGQHYMHITSWSEHQRVNRPSPSRIPPCPIHEASPQTQGGFSEPSVNGHGISDEGSLPRAQARAPADQGAGSREQGAGKGTPSSVRTELTDARLAERKDDDREPKIDYDDLARQIEPHVGTDDPAWAELVAARVLARANGGVTNPVAYVVKAVARSPAEFRPASAQPPVHELCDRHYLPRPCPACADEETP